MNAAKKTQQKDAKKAAEKAVKKTTAKRAAAEKSAPEGAAKQAAVKKTAKKAAEKTAEPHPAKKGAKKTVKQTTPAAEAADRPLRSESEQAELRAALQERLDELVDEQQRFVDSITVAQRERLLDTAGDDQVDSGSKTVEHEHEVSVANAISERIRQVRHALARLDDGDYGICEKCGKPIPAARLAAFPSATLCVSCKQLEERR